MSDATRGNGSGELGRADGPAPTTDPLNATETSATTDAATAPTAPTSQTAPAPSLAPRILTVAIYTLLPVAGLLFLGWDWREVIIVYWLENVVLGVAMVIRMLRTLGDPGTDPIIVNGRAVDPSPMVIFGMTVFFCVHYGLFTLVHGVFVFVIAAGGFGAAGPAEPTLGSNSLGGPDAASLASIDWPGVLLVAAIGGLIQLLMAAFGPLGSKRGGALMMSAYPRIIVLHVTILGGAFLIANLGWPPIAALLLIGMHGLVDLVAIVRAHRAHREPAPA